MKLPIPSFFGKKEIKEYYLALLFQDEQIQAVVFEESNKVIKLVNTATESLDAPVDTISFEKLLFALDHAISTAESALHNGIQTHKTIFGLKESWVENGQIAKSYLATLKKACVELDLQPIGFLIFPEAIAHLLQKEEGAPVSGILIEIGNTTITATLLRAGRIIDSKRGSISDSLPTSVDKLLSLFADVEILPSRIIMADDIHSEHLIQQFINHQWSKSLPFLHMPQVTPLAAGFDVRAILYGTATQMDFTVSETTPPPAPTRAMQFEDTSPRPLPNPPTPQVEEEEQEESEPLKPTQPIPQESADEFGFVQDKDVSENISHPTAFSSHLRDDSFEEPEDEVANETFENIPEEVKDEEQGFGSPSVHKLGSQGAMIGEGAMKIFSRLKGKIASNSFSLQPIFAKLKGFPRLTSVLEGPKLLLGIPVILLLVIGLVVWYIVSSHAVVTLHMNPKSISASANITVTTASGTDLSQNTLGGTAVSVDENGSQSENATGTKNTGDPAKGTVTIYNNSSNSVTLHSGDTITSSNGLKFTLNNDVTVASASGDVFSGTKPGTQDVNVTASTFGTDYNLPSGTTFSTGTDSVAGKNNNAFSGGTKTSFTIVSSSDVTKAENDLITSLENKAKQDLSQKNGQGKIILPTFTSETVSQKNTDKAIGDKANSVTLTATVTYESIAYQTSDATELAQTLLKNQMSNNLTIDGSIQTNLQNITPNKDGTSIAASLQAKANLLPIIDKAHVAQELAGKSVASAQSTLSDIQQLSSVTAVLHPDLLFIPKVLPKLSSHITIVVSGNE